MNWGAFAFTGTLKEVTVRADDYGGRRGRGDLAANVWVADQGDPALPLTVEWSSDVGMNTVRLLRLTGWDNIAAVHRHHAEMPTGRQSLLLSS